MTNEIYSFDIRHGLQIAVEVRGIFEPQYLLSVWNPHTHSPFDAPVRRFFGDPEQARTFGLNVAEAYSEFPERWDWRLLGANVLDVTDARDLKEAAEEGRWVKVRVPGNRSRRPVILTGALAGSRGRRLWIELSDGNVVDLTLGQLDGLAFIFPEEC